MPRDTQWSKLKKRVEALFAPAVAGRVELRITHYRTAHDWEGRGWLTIDGSEVYNFCTLRYYVEFNKLAADLREANGATDFRVPEQRPRYYEAGDEALAILEKRGIVSEKSFERSVQEYPSLSSTRRWRPTTSSTAPSPCSTVVWASAGSPPWNRGRKSIRWCASSSTSAKGPRRSRGLLEARVGSSQPVLAQGGRLGKAGDSNAPGFRQATPVQLDSLDLVQGFSRQIAFSTVWANHDWHVLDHQQGDSFAIAAGHETNFGPALTADVTDHRFPSFSRHRQ